MINGSQPGLNVSSAILAQHPIDTEVLHELQQPDGSLVVPWQTALRVLDLYETGHDGSCDRDLDLLTLILSCEPPPRYPRQLKVTLRGVPGRSPLELDLRWHPTSDIQEIHLIDHGGYGATPDGRRWRLSAGQWSIFDLARSFESHPADRNTALMQTHRIRACVPVGDPGVIWDNYLARENVIAVDNIKPLLVPVKGGYQLRPSVDELADTILENYYFRTPASRLGVNTIETRDGDRRVRHVFSDRARAALHDARRFNKMTPIEVAEALSRPEERLGHNFDLSDFSDRVAGVGPDIRCAVPVVQRADVGDWLEWNADDWELSGLGRGEGDALELGLHDETTRQLLVSAIIAADASGRKYIPHPTQPGVLLELDARLRSAVASASRDPGSDEEAPEEDEVEGAPVLLVKSNLEELELDRFRSSIVSRPKAWVPPPNLQPGIELRAHQQEGYDWLRQLNTGTASGQEGALLADDMGLGKTLQVLAHLDHLSTQGRNGPHLVVAPVALLENWRLEARRFFGEAFEPILIVSNQLPKQINSAVEVLSKPKIVLVGYERLLREEAAFARVDWDTIALDEAQKSKNPDTRIARALRTLKARFRLCMTGTPVENRLRELWTLYDWALPGLLYTLNRFRDEFITPSNDPAVRPQLAEKLLARIGPVFIRRMKHSLPSLNLPSKHFHSVTVGLGDEQLLAYSELVLQTRRNERSYLSALSKLFGVCAHPLLAHGGTVLPDIGDMPFPKGDALFEILDEVRSKNEKALVFATRVPVQRWIQRCARKRYGIQVPVINGSVTGSVARMDVVERFSRGEGFRVLVLAPRAAGVGLNIVAANHVVHYMREWNPAIEAQATDRAYRIGQTRDVHVYTITATTESMETVEERLDRLLDAKRELMGDFIVPMGGFELKAIEFLDKQETLGTSKG
jgi:hypothetical protein